MRRLGNTLYVTSQGSHLSRQGEAVRIGREDRPPLTVPLHGLDGIVLFGGATVTPPLLGHCLESGVTVTWLTPTGRFLGRAEGAVRGNILLRKAQYQAAGDPTEAAAVARAVTTGKVLNQRAVLRRYLRDHGGEDADAADRNAIEAAVDRVDRALVTLGRDQGLDSLRGIEGEAAAAYFSAFGHLIRAPDLTFPGRVRRPPTDLVNALLSFVYVLLTHDIRGALETTGLDPAAGFLHRDRPGRPSLALDLAEEFRAWFADRLVLSLINRRQITPDAAAAQPGGAVHLTESARATVIEAYQARKREDLSHPYTGERTLVGLLWFDQARLLAAHLRNDLDAYPPFVAK